MECRERGWWGYLPTGWRRWLFGKHYVDWLEQRARDQKCIDELKAELADREKIADSLWAELRKFMPVLKDVDWRQGKHVDDGIEGLTFTFERQSCQ